MALARRGRPLALSTLAILGALSGLWLAFHVQDLGFFPWKTKLDFNHPFSTAVDQTGRCYTADSATGRLVAVDRDGSLRWVLEGRKRTQGFFNAVGLAVDSREFLYVANWIPRPGQDAIAQELQIQRYTTSGQLVSTPYRLENIDGSEDFPGYFSFSVQADKLVIVHGRASGYDLWTAPTAGGEAVLTRSVEAPTDFVSIAVAPDGRLAGAGRNGSLWTAAASGNWMPAHVKGTLKPWDLKFDPDGNLLILDLVQGMIVKSGPAGEEVILDSHATKGTFSDTFCVAPSGAVAVADKQLQRLLISPLPGDFMAFDGATFNDMTVLGHWTTWGALAVTLAMTLAGLIAGCVFLVRRQVSLALILAGLLVTALLFSQGNLFRNVYEGLFGSYKTEVRDNLRMAVSLLAKNLSGKDLLALSSPSDLDSPAYDRLRKTVLELRAFGRARKAFSYIALYRQIDGRAHIVLTSSGTFGVSYPYPIFPAEAEVLFSSPGTRVADYSDDYGEYTGGFASVLAPDGGPAGVVEVGLYADLVNDLENSAFADARQSSLFWGSLCFLVVLALTGILVRSFDPLRHTAGSLARLGLNVPVELRNVEAWEPLLHRHQRLRRRISARIVAGERFVPRDLLGLLGEHDVTQITSGVQVVRDLTVAACQTDGKQAEDLLMKVIQGHRGVLAGTPEGTPLVLFPGGMKDALAAFELLTCRLAGLRRRDSIRVGLSHGPVALGLVDEAEPSRVAVASPAVSLAVRLLDLCQHYGASRLVGASTLDSTADARSRRVDYISVPRSDQPVLVREPLDPSDPSKAVLLDYLSGYEVAFSAWDRGDVPLALSKFEALLGRDPLDALVQFQVTRCRKWLEMNHSQKDGDGDGHGT